MTAAQTQIAVFGTAIEAYRVDTGYYPHSLQDLIVKPHTTGWKGPYLKNEQAIPPDPWGHSYVYTYPGRHNTNTFDLMSCGKDSQGGTEDDVQNWQSDNNRSWANR